MTQLRTACKCGISNELDEIERGVGHRGSSFGDIDAISHDVKTHRFLVRELKRPNEKFDPAMRMLLEDLALEQRFTVWYLQLWSDGRIAWIDMLWPASCDVLTRDEYRARLQEWWENRYRLSTHARVDEDLPIRGVR